ncbi:MAG TPA: hypothetical protein VGF69_02020 [Thermoanaerobaculia bacterium]|jgi:hypothetical protein
MNTFGAVLAAVVVQVISASGNTPEQIVLEVDGQHVRAATNAPIVLRTEGEAHVTLVEPATHWAPPLTISEGTAQWTLWPAAELRGRVELPRGETTMPRTVTASIELKREPVKVSCPVDEKGEWRCRLPALPLDVRLEASGFAPHYVWDAALSQARAVTVPPINLTRGASIAGWIASDVKDADLTKATVRLSPLTYGVPTHELRLSASTARPNRRGFFQFTGVPAGTWRLWAEAPAHSRAPALEVNVSGQGETVAKKALLLGRLADVGVAVSPAVDHTGKAWQLRLLRYDTETPYQVTVAKGMVSPDGHWSGKAVETGLYAVELADSTGAVQASQRIDVEPDMAEVFIAVESVAVTGRVHIGDRGVAARLKFTPGSGELVTATSGDDGEFRLVLPFEGMWKLEPKLIGNDQSFEEEKVEIARDRKLDVALPSGHISGRVVDEDDNPVKAGVLIFRQGKPIADILAEDGTFELVGIKPGAVLIEAQSKRGRSSPMNVEIDEDTDPVTLVVRRSVKYEAWLTTAAGHPVAGAQITYRSPLASILGQQTSSPSGRFSIEPEPGTTSITMAIVAPGLPAKLIELPLGDPAERIHIVMNDAGGRLIVRSLDQTVRSGAAQGRLRWLLPTPYIGAGMPSWITEEGVVVYLEPGEYTLCDPAQPQACVTRVVAAGGVVRVGEKP